MSITFEIQISIEYIGSIPKKYLLLPITFLELVISFFKWDKNY